MRYLIAALILLAAPAFAWTDIESMNRHIEQTNFIVGTGCSGTLISVEHRLVLTNNHCITNYVRKVKRDIVEDGEVINKEVSDNRDVPLSHKSYDGHRVISSAMYQSVIVYRDPSLHLALLQMRSTSIPMSSFSHIYSGDSQRSEVVFVVGNPLGLDARITKGIISSTNRMLRMQGVDRTYIQVDAGIARGNSGGALYNKHGELIGVPALTAPGTQVGMAIPYYTIKEFLVDACWASVFDGAAPTYDECSEEETTE